MKRVNLMRSQRGLTLVELMVALVLSLLVVVAAYASLTVARQGFGSVSGASQLRDNARFATAVIEQLAMQAGYKNDYNATYMQASSGIGGFNMSGSSDVANFVSGNSNASLPSGGQAINGSDILTLRYMVSKVSDADGRADQAMINCLGSPEKSTSLMAESRLYVALSNGEPTLMCQYQTSANTYSTGEPLIEGVEVFQVLYGLNDTSDANTNTVDATTPNFAYKSASEITTDAQWRKVRSLRIGMVLRSNDGVASTRESQDYWPLGRAVGDTYKFTSPQDARVRQVVTFTVQLRNNLNPPNLKAVL